MLCNRAFKTHVSFTRFLVFVISLGLFVRSFISSWEFVLEADTVGIFVCASCSMYQLVFIVVCCINVEETWRVLTYQFKKE